MKTNQVMAGVVSCGLGLLGVALGACASSAEEPDARGTSPGRDPDALVLGPVLSPTIHPTAFPTVIPTSTGTATAAPTASSGVPPTVPKDLCSKAYSEKYEGFFCMEKDCGNGQDPFLQFEYVMYESGCRAGGTSPDSQHPTGTRGVVWHINEYKEERLWLYGVCPMQDVDAKQAVDKFHTIDPVDSFTAYYCYPDGVTLTTPTRTIYTTWGMYTESALAFVPVWDPRCGACVVGSSLVPPAAPPGP